MEHVDRVENKNVKITKEQWIQFIALVFGAFVAIEAMVFQAPAIPAIAQAFEIPTSLSGLIVVSFYVMSAAFYPVTGRLADQFGRRKIILIGMVIFAFSEYGAALSPTYSFLLSMRALQGIAVACVFPVVIAYIGVIFPPEKRGFASGIFNGFQGIASMTGAAVAGILITKYGWPIIYWVGGTLAVAGFFAIFFFVKESKGESKAGFDIPGIILIFIATACLISISTLVEVFGLTSSITLGAVVVGVSAAIALWFVENKVERPIMELSLLRNRIYTLIVIIYLINIAAMQLYIYTMNFFLSLRPGGDAAESGFFFFFVYFAGVIGGLIAGTLSDRVNNKRLLFTVLVFPFIALIINAQISYDISFTNVALIAFLFGIGSSVPILIKLGVNVIPPEKYGAGSGLLAFIRDFGVPFGSVTGIVTFSSMSANATQSALVNNARTAGIDNDLMGDLQEAAMTNGETISTALSEKLQSLGVSFEQLMLQASGEGITFAVNNLSYIGAGLFLLLIILTLFIPGPKKEKLKKTIHEKEEMVEQTN